jgi:hypothetical protein
MVQVSFTDSQGGHCLYILVPWLRGFLDMGSIQIIYPKSLKGEHLLEVFFFQRGGVNRVNLKTILPPKKGLFAPSVGSCI